jgi:large subunit ribosomal protein L15
VGQLAIFSPGSEVTPGELFRAGLISTVGHPTKILGTGDIKHALVVSADKFSSSAEEKIVAAGGSIKQA